jgi:hypothetical protein
MNLWRSDPQQPLPQWLQLDWVQAQNIAQVELTFPGQLMQEYHSYPPFYRAPECPKDYSLQAWQDGAWVDLLTVQDNYQRHRIHRLPQAAHTAKLRVLVLATHGDPCASIYEVRCYA